VLPISDQMLNDSKPLTLGPGVCEVRQRQLLHGFGEPSPPQCSDDGSFLPVQCKFVNTSDRMIFDLLHTFNRWDMPFLQTYKIF